MAEEKVQQQSNGNGKKSLIELVAQWPLSRKLSLAAVALISLAVFGLIIAQARVADYRLLFANLTDSDASGVVTWLKEHKIPYRFADGGKAIHIPADQVYEVRIELAGTGIPQGGGVGFELFDKQSFGMTDFAQKINYQRALQGELARTITSLAPVEGARVHLALPEKRLFKEQQKDATASVILKLVPGQKLKESQIQGIINLVSGSIEGLESENVTVIDSSGQVLSRKASEGQSGPMTPGMLDYQQTVERRLEERAQSLLDRALGSSNSLVKVTAEVDFSQVEKVEELYDPKGAVARSEQVSEEKSGSETSGGVPGVAANLADGTGATASTPSSRSSETTNYEISKVVNRIVAPVGTIKSLSVAVLVADRMVPGNAGEAPKVVPRNEQELLSIENMVKSALGIDQVRGDQLKVVSMPFETSFSDEVVSAPAPVSSIYDYLPYVKYGLILLAGLLAYFLLVRPLLRTLKTETVTEHYKTVEQLEAELLTHDTRHSLASDPASELRDGIIEGKTTPAQVIKTWLKEG